MLPLMGVIRLELLQCDPKLPQLQALAAGQVTTYSPAES